MSDLVASACCVPSKERAARLQQSRRASELRPRTTSGSTEGMRKLDGGTFLMGSNSSEAIEKDGEGPVRTVVLDAFYIDVHPVTNAQFHEFIQSTNYRTESERLGWSFVFQGHIAKDRYEELVCSTVPGVSWWCQVNGADWRHPEGPDSTFEGRFDCPVTHVSWNDTAAIANGSVNAYPQKRNGNLRRAAASSRNSIRGAMN